MRLASEHNTNGDMQTDANLIGGSETKMHAFIIIMKIIVD